MNNLHSELNQLINDLANYLNFQQGLYGDEILVDPDVQQVEISQPLDDIQQLSQLEESMKSCEMCLTPKTPHQLLFGCGNSNARLMIIGDCPSKEDLTNQELFSNDAGKLLTKILNAIQISRDEVYLTNIIKCHHKQGTESVDNDFQKCMPYLNKQIELIHPEFILALGQRTGQFLLNITDPIAEFHGKIFEYLNSKLMTTYHPADLLIHPEWKRATWDDVQILQKMYNEAK